MGRAKAWLPFGEELLLQRLVRILRTVVEPLVVVAARGQELPPLPAEVPILRDEHEAWGPLAGLYVGLRALQPVVPAAFVSSCDVPLLRPEFVRGVCGRLGTAEMAIPCDGSFRHPLAAVYRTHLAERVAELLAARRLRPVYLMEGGGAVEIPVDELRGVDPGLDSLRNLNTPEEYAAALRDCPER